MDTESTETKILRFSPSFLNITCSSRQGDPSFDVETCYKVQAAILACFYIEGWIKSTVLVFP